MAHSTYFGSWKYLDNWEALFCTFNIAKPELDQMLKWHLAATFYYDNSENMFIRNELML